MAIRAAMVAFVMAIAFASCSITAPTPFMATVTYVGAVLAYNNSVGNEWTTVAKVNDEEIPPDWPVTVSGTEITLYGYASEWDEGASDVADETLTVRQAELGTDATTFTVSVVVTENGGRYKGHTARWDFTFTAALAAAPAGG